MENKKVIFHVDVNSAFLSWTAVSRLKAGEEIDLRTIPSIIGYNEMRGVVLAKSVPVKKLNIKTGESIQIVKRKYPNIVIMPPDFKVYSHFSKSMMELLKDYTPSIEQYSIDECFMDMTNFLDYEPIKVAQIIKKRIFEELGFTVNIGISCNKILAKMASEREKPDKIHTLYPQEISEKLWPLPVGELFMVGRKSAFKLNEIGIYTIGDLAKYNLITLKKLFKSSGILMWNYANGIDNSEVDCNDDYQIKIISNSTTFSKDISTRSEAHKTLLSLCDNVSSRLRKTHRFCYSIAVSIRDSEFKNYSHQKKLKNATDSTKIIYDTTKELFDKIWKGEPIRLLGVAISNLEYEDTQQISMFGDIKADNRNKALDKVIDNIRERFGDDAVIRSVFLEKKK